MLAGCCGPLDEVHHQTHGDIARTFLANAAADAPRPAHPVEQNFVHLWHHVDWLIVRQRRVSESAESLPTCHEWAPCEAAGADHLMDHLPAFSNLDALTLQSLVRRSSMPDSGLTCWGRHVATLPPKTHNPASFSPQSMKMSDTQSTPCRTQLGRKRQWNLPNTMTKFNTEASQDAPSSWAHAKTPKCASVTRFTARMPWRLLLGMKPTISVVCNCTGRLRCPTRSTGHMPLREIPHQQRPLVSSCPVSHINLCANCPHIHVWLCVRPLASMHLNCANICHARHCPACPWSTNMTSTHLNSRRQQQSLLHWERLVVALHPVHQRTPDGACTSNAPAHHQEDSPWRNVPFKSPAEAFTDFLILRHLVATVVACNWECTKTANFFSASARSTLSDFFTALSSCASSSSRDHLSIAKSQQRTTRHGECRRAGSGFGPWPANHGHTVAVMKTHWFSRDCFSIATLSVFDGARSGSRRCA